MSGRRRDVQAFLDVLVDAFSTVELDPPSSRCLDKVMERVRRSVGAAGEADGRRLPACASMQDALQTANLLPKPLADVGKAFEALEPAIVWCRREAGPNASDNILVGHANALILGPGGLEDRDDVLVGLSLLAPNTRYPDHQHLPEEIYLVLSAGQFRQADGDWFEPGPGGSFYNTPNIMHAMRSGAEPLLAVWCLAAD